MFPDIIQVPYNIFDRRFKESLEELNQNNVEVHSRSVFLQGLFFLSPETLKPILKPLKQELINLQSACSDHEIAIPRAALGFVNAEKCIDKIVIGITSASELKANIEYLNGDDLEMAFLSKLETIHIKESQLLNPGNWN
jgi:aryl-alcohol dehydrogenase-like predicted oxidoreductase